MNKAILSSAILLYFGLGCSSAPQQTYRLSGSTEAAWQITGEWKESLLGDDTVIIFIDGEQVIKGKYPILSNTIELSGAYKGKQIVAACTRNRGWLGYEVRAMIFVDNERAATLQF